MQLPGVMTMLAQLSQRGPVILKSVLDRKLNAVELLIQDHLKIEVMFLRLRVLNQLSMSIPSRKTELRKRRSKVFEELRETLTRHTAAEEAVFYPECESHERMRALALESYEEHKQIKALLKDLSSHSYDSESFEAKLAVLIEDVRRHVRLEEEKLFPRARRAFTASQLAKLGGQLRNFRKQTRRAMTEAA